MKTAFNLIEDYQCGMIDAAELLKELESMEYVTKGTEKAVYFIKSNSIYFVIQSGICHQFKLKIELL